MFEWRDFLAAIALLLVLEGLLPMTMPAQWRALLMKVSTSVGHRSLRIVGAVSVISGFWLLSLVR